MGKQRSHYMAFLLRLWQEEDGGQFVWRASLESPRAKQRRGFDDVASLFAFLESAIQAEEHGEPENDQRAWHKAS